MTTTKSQAQHTHRRVLDDKRHMQWSLLPILDAIQDAPGHMPPAFMAHMPRC